MIEGLKPYADYKDSGLNWLGQIPVSWETPRTKTRFRLSLEKSGLNHGKELLSVYTHIGVRPRKDLEERGNKASSTNDYWVVRQGDIIVNKLLAWMGAVGVSHFDGVTSPAYDILRPIQILEPDFYHFLFRTKLYLQLFKSRSRGIMDMRLRLYFDQLGQIPLICPPPNEQAAIVRFLDHANRKIDGFIRAKRKLIGLLNEQKQAIIHHAVTRGLDPDVPLKPSGIPWLGDIPKHWEARKLGSLFLRHGSGTTPSGDAYYGGGVLWVMSGDLKDGFLVTTKRTVTESALKDFSVLKLHPKGSLLVAMYGATIGKTGVLNIAACCNQACCALTSPRSTVNPVFIQSIVIMARPHLMQQAYGGGQPNINAEVIRSLRVPLPPLAEQDSILAYLDGATNPLTTAIARTEREIALMQEYRTRLTADMVTGKLDVREAAAKLPDLPTDAAAELFTGESPEHTDILDEIEPEES